MHRKCLGIFTLSVLLTVGACDDNGEQVASTAGASSTGGSSTSQPTGGAGGNTANQSAGGKSSGGTMLGTSGGSTNVVSNNGGTTNSVGGAAGQGGSVVAGNPCTTDCPTGTVTVCTGSGCPMGICDNSGFQASKSCTSLYPAPAGTDTVYCTEGQNGAYCLKTRTNDFAYWAVTCSNGTPQITYCPNSCGIDSSGAANC